jgi:hypothetical protein
VDTNELIAYAREEAALAVESTEYDSVKLLSLLNQARIDVFEPVITAARCGYWVHTLTRTLGANNPIVRLPPRTAAFLQADIRVGTGQWHPLPESTEAEAQDWERQSTVHPCAYIIRGSTMHLLPAASTDATYSIRIKIVVRPSKLYLPQATGAVTNVDLTTNIITLASLPVDKATSTTITGTLNVDVIEPSDNFELSLFHAQATVIDATHVQVATGYSLARIQVGDYLRVANQSEWPQLPEPFHRWLASAAAITPCSQRNLYDQASDLQQSTAAAVTRLATHLAPRSRAQTQERRPIQHSWT